MPGLLRARGPGARGEGRGGGSGPAAGAVLRCAASGAQCSAPPVRLAAELGISCLLFGLYVVSSHQEEFNFLPPHTTFLPPTPQRPLSLGNLPVELAQR